MENHETKNSELYGILPSENKKGVANHRKMAAYLRSAADQHIEAADYHEAGEHEKAAESTIRAQGFVTLASEAQNEDGIHHALGL